MRIHTHTAHARCRQPSIRIFVRSGAAALSSNPSTTSAPSCIRNRHQSRWLRRICRSDLRKTLISHASAQQESETEETIQEGDISAYTPAQFVAFSEEDPNVCSHELVVVVNADIESCFNTWNDWTQIVKFFDLIGQIGLDDDVPHLALLQCFYQWKPMPILELTFALSKTEVVANKSIAFKSIYGAPVEGKVEFTAKEDGSTEVVLNLKHGIPLQLMDFVGRIPVTAHVLEILSENLVAFKQLMENPSDDPDSEPLVSEDSWHPQPDVTHGAGLIDRFVEMAEEAEAREQQEEGEEGEVL